MKRDARQILTELLVLQAQAGDEGAFRDLHDLWRADVLRMAIDRVDQLEQGREVAQDAWIDIARGLARINDPACFPRWALQIVQRRSADAVRRNQRDRRRSTALRAEVETGLGVNENKHPESTALGEAVNALSREERALIRLYYEVGRSVAEIAEILAVPIGTVKSRLHQVRERLKTKINQDSS